LKINKHISAEIELKNGGIQSRWNARLPIFELSFKSMWQLLFVHQETCGILVLFILEANAKKTPAM